jgi:hypothetical protein
VNIINGIPRYQVQRRACRTCRGRRAADSILLFYQSKELGCVWIVLKSAVFHVSCGVIEQGTSV